MQSKTITYLRREFADLKKAEDELRNLILEKAHEIAYAAARSCGIYLGREIMMSLPGTSIPVAWVVTEVKPFGWGGDNPSWTADVCVLKEAGTPDKRYKPRQIYPQGRNDSWWLVEVRK